MRSLDTFELILAAVASGLLIILIVSFRSRARVFCQYLRLMTGISLTPGEVRQVFRLHGKEGVRELFLDLMIREDLEDSSTITPETPRSKPVAALIKK
jgi:hypothetical protein